MPQLRELPAATLEAIAYQIAGLMRFQANLLSTAKLDIGETLEIWFLEPLPLSPDASFASLPRPSGQWHHQIRSEGSGTHYARSTPFGPNENEWDVRCVVKSTISEKVHEAIRWIDRTVPDDGSFGRLLVVPSFHMHAIWLHSETYNRIVIVDMPKMSGLRYKHVYTGDEFLKAIWTKPRTRGIPESDLFKR